MTTTELSLALLSAYNLAGCLMEHFVVFYGWSLTTSATELKHIQTPTGIRTGIVYIIPKIVLTALMLRCTGSSQHERLLAGDIFGIDWTIVSTTLLATSWASSFLVQIPLQLQIQKTGDRKALERLILTDWIRVLSMVGHCTVLAVVIFTSLTC
jgi:hypothetical protein